MKSFVDIEDNDSEWKQCESQYGNDELNGNSNLKVRHAQNRSCTTILSTHWLFEMLQLNGLMQGISSDVAESRLLHKNTISD
jgi:hypothetical protein